MKKLIIFDLDGTLLNTIADLANATNYALSQLGFGMHPLESYPTFVGNGIRKLFERALPATCNSPEWVEKVRELFIPFYDAHNADDTTIYTGIQELLDELQEKGIKIAVASNKYQSATEKLMHHYFPNISFVSVLGQRDGIPVKPDPSIVHSILQISGTDVADTLYVGDSGVDMQTAKNAGVESIGVTWGFRPIEELEGNGAKHLANSPKDILQYIC